MVNPLKRARQQLNESDSISNKRAKADGDDDEDVRVVIESVKVLAPETAQLSDFVIRKPISSDVLISKSMKMRDVYISNVRPDTRESIILDHLKKFELTRNSMDVITCKKLIRRNIDINNLTFLSFKLCVPEKCFEFVVDPSNWPSDIVVKEFENRQIGQTLIKARPNTQSNTQSKNQQKAKSKPNVQIKPKQTPKNVKPNTVKKPKFASSNQKNLSRRTQFIHKPKWRIQNTSGYKPAQLKPRMSKVGVKPKQNQKPNQFVNQLQQFLLSQLFQAPLGNM